MGIKGSATIELTNADGSKEIYKHDNMITNAVQDLCMSQRGEIATILKIVNRGDSYAQELFGGLLLFDETLNTDANDYFLPTVKCTGYASQDAYAGLDTCRGSFNASEGGVQPDGSYKFVWDFATSQANGTIKSLALVPNMMGKIGLTTTAVSSESSSFAMKRTRTDPFSPSNEMLNSNVKIDDCKAETMIAIATIGDVVYAISTDNTGYAGSSGLKSKWIMQNGGILRLYRFKLGANSIALTDKVCEASYIDYVDITLPSDFISTLSTAAYRKTIACRFIPDAKKLIVYPLYRDSKTQINETLKYCEVDFNNNYSVNVYTFTNNTAGYIENDGESFFILKDYIICCAYVVGESGERRERRLYIIKKSDNTQVKEVKIGGEKIATLYLNIIRPKFWNDKILVLENTKDTSTSIPTYYYLAIDLTTGEARETNSFFLSGSPTIDIEKEVVFVGTGGTLTYFFAFNPFILCTKNNLDSPVTKTASQTMKITYTLSVAGAEGSEV